MSIKVFISWSAWAGKSTVIKHIVEKLWYDYFDIWQVFRSRAVAKWLTISEYDKLVEKNPQEDIEMDNEFKNIIQNNPNDCIASWRIGFYFIPDSLTIWLDVSPQEWAKRILFQDRGKQEKKYKNITEVIEANQQRMFRLQKRLKKLYWVDFMDKNNYKKIINTDWKTLEETVRDVIKTIQEYKIKFKL